MRADDPLRALRHRRDLGDRDRRGVGGEDRVLPDQLVQRAEDLVLDLKLLEHRLHDDVRVGDRVQIGRRGDPRERRIGVGRLQLALRDEPRVGRLDGIGAAGHGRIGDIAQNHVPAGLGRHLRDSEPMSPAPMTASFLANWHPFNGFLQTALGRRL